MIRLLGLPLLLGLHIPRREGGAFWEGVVVGFRVGANPFDGPSVCPPLPKAHRSLRPQALHYLRNFCP